MKQSRKRIDRRFRMIPSLFHPGADDKGVAGTKFDPEFLSRFEKVAQVPEEEKNAVLVFLDSVIAKHTIRKIMGS